MSICEPSMEGKKDAARIAESKATRPDELKANCIGRWPQIFEALLKWPKIRCNALREGRFADCPGCGAKLKPSTTFTTSGRITCLGGCNTGDNGFGVLREFSGREYDDLYSAVSDFLKTLPPTDVARSITSAKGVNGNSRITAVPLSTVTTCPIEWLWPYRIPLGAITLLVGRPGCGKSRVSAELAARISTGAAWPDGATNETGDVLLLSGEDEPARVIRPRLETAGGDAGRVHIVNNLYTLDALCEFEALFKANARIRLVVIDPIGSYLGRGCDAHRDNEVRGVLAPLAELAGKYRFSVLIVCHQRKGKADYADDLAIGSVAFTGIARAVWHVADDPSNKGRKLLLSGKNNYAPPQAGLAFSIEGEGQQSRIVWETEPVSMTADEFFAQRETRLRRAPRGNEAADWLRDFLSVGLRPADEIAKAAQQEGISEYALRAAVKALNVAKNKGGFQGAWQWSLPTSGAPNVSEAVDPP